MESVLLIAPRSKNKCASDISMITTPLSGILILGKMLKENGYSVTIYDETFKIPNYEKLQADYVLITAMSATVKRAYELGDYFKNKGSKVFMGGLHVSFKPNEAINHCDKVVIGEGENILFSLFDDDSRDRIIKGSPVMDLDSIPIPDNTLLTGITRSDNVSICTSRGCPFECKFCSLNAMFGTKYRSISTNKIIDYLSRFNRIKTLCFDEANFAADKNRVKKLLRQMIEYDISPKNAWPSVGIDVAKDEEFLKLCTEVSNFHFGIGLESINHKVLKDYNKKQTPETMKKSIKKIKDYGIKIFGFFIFGADEDDKTVFQKTVDFCQDTEVDFPSFSALTPYVGTDIRQSLENDGRIFTNNWDYYDGAHVVFHPKKMSAYELQEGIIQAFQDFYSKSKIMNHILKGEFLYGFGSLRVNLLLKKIIRENHGFLTKLENIHNSMKTEF